MAGIVYIPSPLGPIRIQSTGRFISAIEFVKENEEVLPETGDEWCAMAAGQLQEYFKGERLDFGFPFEQKGTGFQQRVWAELLQIPCGRTISYLDLARNLQDEKCIRAAASANGKNRIAIVVPCHRVIGSGGKLVGYAGGLWRKKWLLDHEQKLAGRAVQQTLFG